MRLSSSFWIDTHCHLDAPEFDTDRAAVRARALAAGVQVCVWPAVEPASFAAVQAGARAAGDAYALGIHPLRVEHLADDAVDELAQALGGAVSDAALVAVGEIGLDAFVASAQEPGSWARQRQFLRHQVALARGHGLPVLVHARRAVDAVTAALRAGGSPGGIVHAFNGSDQQAHALLDLGMALGFGGACTFERALRLRDLARRLPLDAIVLETDAPDIPPHWLYQTAQARAQGLASGRNEPGELPAIAVVVAELRGLSLDELADATTCNARRVLPRLAAWLDRREAPSRVATEAAACDGGAP